MGQSIYDTSQYIIQPFSMNLLGASDGLVKIFRVLHWDHGIQVSMDDEGGACDSLQPPEERVGHQNICHYNSKYHIF